MGQDVQTQAISFNHDLARNDQILKTTKKVEIDSIKYTNAANLTKSDRSTMKRVWNPEKAGHFRIQRMSLEISGLMKIGA